MRSSCQFQRLSALLLSHRVCDRKKYRNEWCTRMECENPHDGKPRLQPWNIAPVKMIYVFFCVWRNVCVLHPKWNLAALLLPIKREIKVWVCVCVGREAPCTATFLCGAVATRLTAHDMWLAEQCKSNATNGCQMNESASYAGTKPGRSDWQPARRSALRGTRHECMMRRSHCRTRLRTKWQNDDKWFTADHAILSLSLSNALTFITVNMAGNLSSCRIKCGARAMHFRSLNVYGWADWSEPNVLLLMDFCLELVEHKFIFGGDS